MTLNISDIAIFPHELQGLKLWDNDIIISRYIILESEKFRSKNVLIFRAGVGIAGITLRKWTDAKEVAMCDFRDEVIKNQSSNCAKNGAKNIHFFKINYD
jgi:predicted nicotinamide N-methyase